MKRLFKFLANRKGSAFIETLMVYVCVALIGVAVVGVLGKTIKDAAADSPYQSELTATGGTDIDNNGGSSSNTPTLLSFTIVGMASEPLDFVFEEGMTWGDFLDSEYNGILEAETRWFQCYSDYVCCGVWGIPISEEESGDYIAPDELIIANHIYVIVP